MYSTGGISVSNKKPKGRLFNIFSRYKKDYDYDKPISIHECDIRSDANLNFKIFSASGGYVLEFYRYDRQRDESYTKMYVISDTEELSESIALICQQEFLQL
jgi:hypothetical protein